MHHGRLPLCKAVHDVNINTGCMKRHSFHLIKNDFGSSNLCAYNQPTSLTPTTPSTRQGCVITS